MAKTLLNGVNEVLKRASVLDSDAGELTSLSNDAHQTFIDIAVQVLNEIVDELYSVSQAPKPNQLKEDTITLAADDQDYALASDLVRIRPEYHLIDETNNHFITILGEDGYRQIILGDLEQDDTGLPHFAAIRPTDGELFMSRSPTADEAGRVYKYRYERELELTDAADEFPFSDSVFRAVVPAAVELFKLNQHREFSQPLLRSSLGRAARLFRQLPPRESWGPQRPGVNVTDPMVE